MADRPTDPALDRDFARDNGWDADYETYSDFDLPTYVGPTTFMNLPWITDPAELRRLGVDVAIVGAPFDDAVSHRPGARFGPRAIREAQYASGSIHSLQLDVDAVRCPDRRRRRRRQHRPGLDRTRPRDDLPQGPRGRRDRRDPDHPRWRPLDHLAGGDGHRRGPPPGQHRDRPFRRPRRHRHRRLRRPGQPRHADAPPHRVGRGQGQELRPGRAARLLAATGHLRLDAGAGPALALHARDRGARRGGGHRRRDRRGARRPRRDLPLARHRRHRPGHGARAPARPNRAAC